MNETNRLIVTLFAALCIVIAAAVIFLTWARPDATIERLVDVVQFLNDHNDDTGKLIVTLASLAFAFLALLVIIVELAPEDEPTELKVEQAGATTIIPADALRKRLEEALLDLPEVTAARSRVWSKEAGIAAKLDLTVTPEANLANVTQEASRVVVDVVQTDLGLPVAGVPSVKVHFGGSKAVAHEAATLAAHTEPPTEHVETVDERISTPPPAAEPTEPQATAEPEATAEPPKEAAPEATTEPERRPMGVVEAEGGERPPEDDPQS